VVEIEDYPTKKIVVHEIYKYDSKEELVKRVVGPSGIRPVFWCDGILFVFYMDDSDDARKDYLKGIMHWDAVAYTEMPSYRESIELEEDMFKGVKVPVINYSKFGIFKEFVKWLKARKA
jgi:hypothetical protein